MEGFHLPAIDPWLFLAAIFSQRTGASNRWVTKGRTGDKYRDSAGPPGKGEE